MDFDDWQTAPGKNKPSSNDWDGFDPSQSQQNTSGGGVHWLLTLLSLAFTGGTAFLIAWLVRDIPNRSIPLVGLMFMAPATVLTLTALFLEHTTSLMTPWCSRRLQAVLALAASGLVFLVGCLAQLSYVIADVQPANYIFLVDKSSSMGMGFGTGTDIENQRGQALNQLLNKLKDGTIVGLVLFNDEVLAQECLGPAKLDANTRSLYIAKLARDDIGGTSFSLPLSKALDMLEANKDLTGGRSTHIVMLTDGDPNIIMGSDITDPREPVTLLAKCKKYNASVSSVKIGGEIRSELLNGLITATNGVSLTVDSADQLAQGLTVASAVAGTDVLRDTSIEAKWICGVLFILTGLIIGAGLSLMLSRQRQFRLQFILSPLAGAAAFMVCKYIPGMTAWLREGIAFSAYGLVFMKKNR